MCRSAARAPGFTIAGILIVGFGVGINAGVFGLIEAIFLRPLPFKQPDRLMSLFLSRPNVARSSFGYPIFKDVRNSQSPFEALAISFGDQYDLTDRPQPIRMRIHYSTSSIFRVSGVPFVLGRPYTDEEDKPNGPFLVVLSERVWRSAFNADPQIVGKVIRLSDHSFEIVGVCPPQADNLDTNQTDLYVPSNIATVYGYHLDQPSERLWYAVGRLKQGVNPAQAEADLRVVYSNISAQYPPAEKGFIPRVEPILTGAMSAYSDAIWLVGAAAGVLFLIAVINLAGLVFVRVTNRRREMAIRSAIGANKGHLIKQILLEVLGLALGGGVLGVVIASATTELIKVWAPRDLYRIQNVQMDVVVFGCVLVLSTLAALGAGLFPAWRSAGVNPGLVLKEDGGLTGTASRSHQRSQSMLVIAQVALAFALIVCAALLGRSFQAILSAPLGFEPHQIFFARVYPTSSKYDDPLDLRRFFDAIFEKIQKVPEIEAAGMNSEPPFRLNVGYPTSTFQLIGRPPTEQSKEPVMTAEPISPGYFRTMKIPLVAGRDFTAEDRADKEYVCIVDREFADKFFPDKNCLGEQISDHAFFDKERTWTIVGIVGNSLSNRVDNLTKAPPQVYFPYDQRLVGEQYLLLRTKGDLLSVLSNVRRAVAEVDPDVVVTEPHDFERLISEKYASRRLGIYLMSIYSLAALFLAGAGLYCLLVYFVAQRNREIAVRIALGATGSDVVKLVLLRGVSLTSKGTLIGIVAAMIAFLFMRTLLYETGPIDPLAIGFSIAIVGFVSLSACAAPAFRAALINPVRNLRDG
jgi:putative ABC transport system permease protein